MVLVTVKEASKVLVLSEIELADLKLACYFAMKSLDDKDVDKRLADRLEILYEQLP